MGAIYMFHTLLTFERTYSGVGRGRSQRRGLGETETDYTLYGSVLSMPLW